MRACPVGLPQTLARDERRAAVDPDAADSLDRCLAGRHDDHANLHTSVAMRRALDRRFAERRG
jgi:hypothetical protein